MYKAFIEPDLRTAHLKVVNSFNPFAGFRIRTYILKSDRVPEESRIKAVLGKDCQVTDEVETADIYLLPPNEDPETCTSWLRMRNRDGHYTLMFAETVTDGPIMISPRIKFEVGVRILGGLMALGYVVGAIMKRRSKEFSDDLLTIKVDWVEGLDRSFVQVQGRLRSGRWRRRVKSWVSTARTSRTRTSNRCNSNSSPKSSAPSRMTSRRGFPSPSRCSRPTPRRRTTRAGPLTAVNVVDRRAAATAAASAVHRTLRDVRRPRCPRTGADTAWTVRATPRFTRRRLGRRAAAAQRSSKYDAHDRVTSPSRRRSSPGGKRSSPSSSRDQQGLEMKFDWLANRVEKLGELHRQASCEDVVATPGGSRVKESEMIAREVQALSTKLDSMMMSFHKLQLDVSRVESRQYVGVAVVGFIGVCAAFWAGAARRD